MKKIIVALITLGLLLAPITAVQAQSNGETVYVLLDFDDTVYVYPEDNVILVHGWGACTRGLVQAYLTAVHTEISFNDETVMADGKDPHWWPIINEPDSWIEPYCIAGNQNTFSASYWLYPLDPLTSGEEYVVHYYNWLDHPIIDGADYDSDGRLDRYEGVLADRTITIIVNE